jgi:hypothetical protein
MKKPELMRRAMMKKEGIFSKISLENRKPFFPLR